MVFNLIEVLEFVFSKDFDKVVTKKISIYAKLFLIVCFPFWPVMVTGIEAVRSFIDESFDNDTHIKCILYRNGR